MFRRMNKGEELTVCYFGDFDPEYARNKVIIKGLRRRGAKVLLCNTRRRGSGKYLDLWRKHWQLRGKYGALIVGHSDNRWMTPLARILTGKKVIWDGFYSLYDSWVHDRKVVSENSLKARYYWFVDRLNGMLANTILTDTDKHTDYFVKEFKVRRSKCIRIYIGADNDVFHP